MLKQPRQSGSTPLWASYLKAFTAIPLMDKLFCLIYKMREGSSPSYFKKALLLLKRLQQLHKELCA